MRLEVISELEDIVRTEYFLVNQHCGASLHKCINEAKRLERDDVVFALCSISYPGAVVTKAQWKMLSEFVEELKADSEGGFYKSANVFRVLNLLESYEDGFFNKSRVESVVGCVAIEAGISVSTLYQELKPFLTFEDL